jgi:hypothetical protein
MILSVKKFIIIIFKKKSRVQISKYYKRAKNKNLKKLRKIKRIKCGTNNSKKIKTFQYKYFKLYFINEKNLN